MKCWRYLPILCLGLCGFIGLSQAQTLALVHDRVNNTQTLAEVSATGGLTTLGTGVASCCSVSGALAARSNDTVFFVGNPTGSTTQTLYLLDSTTGNMTQAGQSFLTTLNILALAWDDDNDRLLALSRATVAGTITMQLNTVNTTDATLTPIGAGIADCCGVAVGVNALDADNQLWFVVTQQISTSQWQIITIDLSTGDLVMLAADLTQPPVSLSLDVDLMAIYHDASSVPGSPVERLATLDAINGDYTDIGTGLADCCFAIQGVAGIADDVILSVARLDAATGFAFFSTNIVSGVFTQQSNVPTDNVINALLGEVGGPEIVQGGSTTVVIDEDNTPQSFALTLDAIDELGGGLSWSISTPATMGTASVTTGTGLSQVINYTVNADVNGNDSFVVEVMDANADTDSIIVNVQINPVNDAPSFVIGAKQTVNEDAGLQTVANWVTAISPGPANEAAQLVQFLVSNDNAGLFSAAPAVAADGTLSYTPAPNVSGSATVMVQVMDDGGTASGGQDTSAVQVATITILPVNDAPSFVAGPDQSILEEAGPQTVPAWATAISPGPADEVSQLLNFVVSNNNSAFFSQQPVVDAATGTLSYTPALDAAGTAIVSVQLMDNGGVANGGVNISAVQMFNINIEDINDAPSFTSGPDQTPLEDAGPQTIAWATNIDPGAASETGQTLTFIVSNNNNALFTVQPAIDQTGILTFTTAADEVGSALVDVQLMDDGGTANGGMDSSAVFQFSIDVIEVNDAPSFTIGPNQTVLEDSGAQTVAIWVTNISPGPASENSQVLTFSVSSDNTALFSQQPAVDGATGTLTFTSAADAVGIATLSVQIMDDGGTANGGVDTSVVQMATIELQAVNDPPSFTIGANQTVDEDAGAQTVNNWVAGISTGPADESAQTVVQFIVSNDNAGLFAVAPAVALDGTLTYTPADDESGIAVVSVQAMDDGGTADGGVDTSAIQTAMIEVRAVNDAPSFVPGPNQTVTEDAAPQTVPAWATDINANRGGVQVLTFLVSNDNNALFSVQPGIDATTGDLTYTPAADANGTALVDVQLMDDGGTANGGVDTSPVEQFSIELSAVNDAPVFVVGPDVFAFDEDGPQVISPWATGIDAGPVDENGQALTFNIIGNTNPAIFAVQPTVAPDGTLSFAPQLDGDDDSVITVELMDDGGIADGGVDTSVPQSFTITVGPAITDLVLSISSTNVPLVIHPFVEFDLVLDLVNNGPQNATNVITEVALSSELEFVSSMGGCASLGGGLVIWNLPILANGDNATCIFTVQVTGLGTLTAVGTTMGDQMDPDPVNNTDITLAQVLESVPLEVPTLSRLSLLLLALALLALGWSQRRRFEANKSG